MLQDHFEIIAIQFINTIVPIVSTYLQRLFDTSDNFVDMVCVFIRGYEKQTAIKNILLENGIQVTVSMNRL